MVSARVLRTKINWLLLPIEDFLETRSFGESKNIVSNEMGVANCWERYRAHSVQGVERGKVAHPSEPFRTWVAPSFAMFAKGGHFPNADGVRLSWLTFLNPALCTILN